MTIFFLIVNSNCINWISFDTEKKLVSACNLCEIIVEKMQKNISYFKNPNVNSSCAKNPSNIFCTFINDVYNDITYRYEDQIPYDYCSLHGPCIFELSPELTGKSCAQCISTITYAFEAEPEKREKTLKNYCSSALGTLVTFCNGIEYVISKSMKNKFLTYQSATDFCLEAAFCTYDHNYYVDENL